MLVLNKEDQKLSLTMREAIDAVATALVEVSTGRAHTPIRISLPVPTVGGTSLFMPSFVQSAGGLGIKFVSVFPRNQLLGKSTIQGIMVLADIQTGEPIALLEASYLTALRTGAASGLATQCLSSEDAKVLGVIGTGAQSRGAISAIRVVRDIQEIRLFNRSLEKAIQLAQELHESADEASPLVVVVNSPEEAVEGADILVTATNSMLPVFKSSALGPGIHINAIGSFRPDMQELPTEALMRSEKVVVESREAALEETGDFVIPIRQGVFSAQKLYAELGDIVRGSKAPRENNEEITIFKSVGLAAMDVVVGKMLYERALKLGLGQSVSL